MLDILAGLVDRSLVVAEAGVDGAVRYRLLDTLRAFGRERLAERADAADVNRRHAAFFVALAEEAEGGLWGPDQVAWRARLDLEVDNFRAALRWAIDDGEIEPTLRFGAALWKFWELRGDLSEGLAWLEEALALPLDGGDPALAAPRARALNGAGALARTRGHYERSARYHEASLALRRRLDDRRGVAASLHNLGVVARDRGDYPGSRAYLEESLTIARELGDARQLALTLLNLGRVARNEGEVEQAAAHFRESIELDRTVGDRNRMGASLKGLAQVALDRGDLAAARTLGEEALALGFEVGDRWGSPCRC